MNPSPQLYKILSDAIATISDLHCAWAIIARISALTSVSVVDIQSHNRHWEIVQARWIAIHFIREYTSLPLSTIGLYFGMKHNSILYALKSFQNEVETSPKFTAQVSSIRAELPRGGLGRVIAAPK